MDIKNSTHWVQRDQKVMAECSKIKYYPFVITKGRGSIVEDADGNQFIDLLSSAACLNLGHSHPKVVEAIKNQAEDFTHYTTAYFYNTKAIEFAEKLVQITPGTFPKKVIFGLTGSDSNDGAIKVARAYTGRNKIIAFNGAYHGATFGALSLTHISLNMRRKIGATLPDIFSFDFPDTYRKGSEDAQRCIQQIESAFSSYLPPEEVAAIIIEPIQGDAGILVPPKKFMQDLANLCKKHGILFISEEVQQGFLRTGKWFGIDHFDIIPDLVILGKPVGGGMPLSAIVGRSEIIDSLGAPAHLFTFSGNPVSCAAGLASLEILSEPGFAQDVNQKGKLMKSLLEKLAEKYDLIGEVRGLGLSLAVDLVQNKETKIAASEAAAKICYRAWEKGVILITLAGNVLRIQPPLIITEKEILQAVQIIDESIEDYLNGDIPDSALEVIKGWK